MRSSSTSCDVSPTDRPSTNTMPLCTVSPRFTPLLESSRPSPFSQMNTFSAGTPVASASLAWARRCVASPCTGMNAFGCTMDSTSFSSSAPAWPDTCTMARFLS